VQFRVTPKKRKREREGTEANEEMSWSNWLAIDKASLPMRTQHIFFQFAFWFAKARANLAFFCWKRKFVRAV